MPVSFRIEHFEGPLDLLLQLVEREELDISTLSLAAVAEQFVEHVHENPKIPPEELADFLMVAAKLMYTKSKLLIPSLDEADLEEGPDLETQLREYRRFVKASAGINKMWNAELRSFPSAERVIKREESGFVLPEGMSTDVMMHVMRRIISRLEPLIRLPETSLERVVTIQQKINDLFKRVKTKANITFRAFLSGARDRTEAVVSFLALLELVKQRFVLVEQGDLFHDINIKHNPDSSQDEPVTNDEFSYSTV